MSDETVICAGCKQTIENGQRGVKTPELDGLDGSKIGQRFWHLLCLNMNTCELCGCTKEHVREVNVVRRTRRPTRGFICYLAWLCDPNCEPENED